VRGLAEDGAGPRDFLGEPTGGNGLFVFNQELRFPIYKWVRGLWFFDAGNVYSRARDWSFKNLEAGAGFGVRIHSPYVLLRIDYGMPLTNRSREPFGRWYFGIGQTF
jgi:outer membrane protein insertion porin family